MQEFRNRFFSLSIPFLVFGVSIFQPSLRPELSPTGDAMRKSASRTELQIQGRVVDPKGRPLEYVNIGIPNTLLGTYSDEAGRFSFAVPKSHARDSVKFSAIGYHTVSRSVGEFVNPTQITMHPKQYQLPPATVTAQQGSWKREKIGGWKSLLPIGVAYFSEEGYQLVTQLRLEVDSAYLEKVRIRINHNPDGGTQARVRVYDSEGDQPGASLLRRSEIQTLQSGSHWLTFDLTDQHIMVSDAFFVGLELMIPPRRSPHIAVRPKKTEAHSWRKSSPQAPWLEDSNHYIMQAIVRYQADSR